MQEQHTLREPLDFEGRGLHTGAAAHVRLLPQPADTGIRFKLGEVEFPALAEYVVETERRFYLTNDVELNVRSSDNGEVYFEVTMRDAWVWDMYRPARFVKNVRVVTFKDVNIEELAKRLEEPY